MNLMTITLLSTISIVLALIFQWLIIPSSSSYSPIHSSSASFSCPSCVVILPPSPPSFVPTYRAAAVQYSPYGTGIFPPPSVSAVLSSNLLCYEQLIVSATASNVSLLLFPEYGLGNLIGTYKNSREGMLPWCETVEVGDNPCQSLSSPLSALSQNQIQLYTISCLAYKYSINLIINICSVEWCNNTLSASPSSSPSPSPSCPSDGRYQYNTDVIFSSSGEIIGKYYKTHLFGETAVFNTPSIIHPLIVTFNLSTSSSSSPPSYSFNDDNNHNPSDPIDNISPLPISFGVFTCFDIDFPHPVQDLLSYRTSSNQRLFNYLYPSWWVNQLPQLSAVLLQQAWSRINGVNIIAANTLRPTGAGGGIFSKGSILSHYFNIEGTNQSIVTAADVPITLLEEQEERKINTDIIYSLSKALLINQQKQQSNEEGEGNIVPCSISAINLNGNCLLLSPSPSTQSHTVTHNSSQCTVSFTLSAVHPTAPFYYAVFSSSSSLSFPDTDSGLFFQSCFVLQCPTLSSSSPSSAPRPSSHSPLECVPISNASAVFDSFSLLGGFNRTLFDASPSSPSSPSASVGHVYPILSVNEGQPTDPNTITFGQLAEEKMNEMDDQLLPFDITNNTYYYLYSNIHMLDTLYSVGLYAIYGY